jgi:thymidylate synthase ThyX
MAYSARILADSISSAGARLTTVEVTFPRMVLAEFNTHRQFSRNSASSRAIPFDKQLERIMNDPFVPIYWGANQPGMQADGEIDKAAQKEAVAMWLAARDAAVEQAKALNELGVHKQLVNRLLEPFMWHTVLVTATEWSNFYALRANPDAQPEIRRAAELMMEAYKASKPEELSEGEWHLPLIQDDEHEWAKANVEEAIKVSIGRCARVSYLTHDGVRDHAKDVELYERLTTGGHMSPLEHVATPLADAHEWSGNFQGWKQFRKTVPNEQDFSLQVKG